MQMVLFNKSIFPRWLLLKALQGLHHASLTQLSNSKLLRGRKQLLQHLGFSCQV